MFDVIKFKKCNIYPYTLNILVRMTVFKAVIEWEQFNELKQIVHMIELIFWIYSIYMMNNHRYDSSL